MLQGKCFYPGSFLGIRLPSLASCFSCTGSVGSPVAMPVSL